MQSPSSSSNAAWQTWNIFLYWYFASEITQVSGWTLASQARATVHLVQTSLVSLMSDTKTVMNGIKSSQETRKDAKDEGTLCDHNGASTFLNPRPRNRRIWPGQSDRGRTFGIIIRWRTIFCDGCASAGSTLVLSRHGAVTGSGRGLSRGYRALSCNQRVTVTTWDGDMRW